MRAHLLASTESQDDVSRLAEEEVLSDLPLDTPTAGSIIKAATRCKSESIVLLNPPEQPTSPRPPSLPAAPPAAPLTVSPSTAHGHAISELLRPAMSASDMSKLADPTPPSKFAEKAHVEASPSGASERPDAPPADGAEEEPCTSERVAFFDLDLTLLDINTGRSWVEKEFREGKVPLQLYLLAIFWFAKYAAGMGIDASEAMALYKGYSDTQMASEVATWWEENCVFHLRPKAREALDAHKKAGERCVLCTASWQHVAEMARRSFQMDDVICSIIEEGSDGRFTGVVTDAYGDNKWVRTAAWAKRNRVDLANCTFYTDSVSDRKLLEFVGRPVCVCPDSKLQALALKNGWPVEEWGEAPVQVDRKLHRYCTVWGLKI